jgi:phage terminase small subunit
MPGRKMTPTALKKLRGNPGGRPLPKGEPKPRVDAPAMPPGLSKAAQAHWKHTISEGVRLKLITTLDHGLLGRYIKEWLDHGLLGRYIKEWDACRELDEQCKKRGRWITETAIDRKGEAYETGVKRAPWDTSLVQHAGILRGLISDLGFSPTARAKVSTVDDDEPKKADLLAFDGGKK